MYKCGLLSMKSENKKSILMALLYILENDCWSRTDKGSSNIAPLLSNHDNSPSRALLQKIFEPDLLLPEKIIKDAFNASANIMHGSASMLSSFQESFSIKINSYFKNIDMEFECLVLIDLDFEASEDIESRLKIYKRLIHYSLSCHDIVTLMANDKKVVDYFERDLSEPNIRFFIAENPIHELTCLCASRYIYSIADYFVFIAKFINNDISINYCLAKQSHLSSTDIELSKFSSEYEKYFYSVRELSFSLNNLVKGRQVLPLNNSSHKRFDQYFGCSDFSTDWIINNNHTILPGCSLNPSFSDLYFNSQRKYSESYFKHSRALLNIQTYLSDVLQSFSVDQAVPANLLKDYHNRMILGAKDTSNCFIPPVLEKIGFSATRHCLFNNLYYIDRIINLANLGKSLESNALRLFLSNGYLVITGFLDKTAWEETKSIFNAKDGSLAKNKSSLIFTNWFDSCVAKKLLSSKVINLLSILTGYSDSVLRKEIVDKTFAQTVTLNKDSSQKDPQQEFHLDTFYPAFKFWYFPFHNGKLIAF